MIFSVQRVQITSVHRQRTLRDRAVQDTVHRLCHKIRCPIHQHLRITHHKLQATVHKVQAIRPPALTIHQQGNQTDSVVPSCKTNLSNVFLILFLVQCHHRTRRQLQVIPRLVHSTLQIRKFFFFFFFFTMEGTLNDQTNYYYYYN